MQSDDLLDDHPPYPFCYVDLLQDDKRQVSREAGSESLALA